MKSLLSVCLSGSLFLSGFASLDALADTLEVTGVWGNQRGSVLQLSDDGRGGLKGTFTTAVGITKACIGRPIPVTGAVNGNALSISLSMAECGSPVVIAMTGTVYEEKKSEHLLMQAVTQYKGPDKWNSRIQTTDFYTRLILSDS